MNAYTKLPLSLLAMALSCMMATNALANDPPAASSAKPKAAAASGPSDDDLSKALLNKINKGSGDIVIRTGDLPAGNPPTQAKPESRAGSRNAVEAKLNPA